MIKLSQTSLLTGILEDEPLTDAMLFNSIRQGILSSLS